MRDRIKEKREPTLLEALIPVLATIILLMVSIVGLKKDAHVPLIFGAAFTAVIAYVRLGFTWKELEQGIISGITDLSQTILILGIIGMIVGIWIQGGIVPTLIYYGLQFLRPGYFLVASMIICSVVSLATGSGWTTAGTIGITLMGVGAGLGVPAPMTAGAIISGAYFGDKMSPLSDTTNLAPAMAGANVFDHIRHMVYTTGVSYGISLILFAAIGLRFRGAKMDIQGIQAMMDGLKASFFISPILLIPPVLVILMVARKAPAVPGLFFGVVLGAICAVVFQHSSLGALLETMQYGFVLHGEDKMLNQLLSSGGIQNMMWALSLTLCAITFGGILERTKMLEVLARRILRLARSTGALVSATVCSCIFVNLLTGDQYLSIILPGKMYREEFHKRGLAPRNLSRCLEDSGTLTSPLIPWSSCSAVMVSALGISTLKYLPFCFLNLVNPFVSIIFGFTGLTMMQLKDDPSAAEYEEKNSETKELKSKR